MNIQVKKIAFTTLLLFAANTWAAEELPIELTCEIGHLIVYYHITGSTDTTWWQNHSTNRFDANSRLEVFWDYRKNKVRNPVRDLEINTDSISFFTRINRPNYRYRMYTYINRLTGKASMWLSSSRIGVERYIVPFDGRCIKGFWGYENNVF